MQTLKVLFIKLLEKWQFFKSQIVKLQELLLLLIKKFLGKEKYNQIIDLKNNANQLLVSLLYGHLNQDGKNYLFIRKLYKITYNTIFGILIFIFFLKTNFLWLTGKMPSIEELQNPKLSQASTIYSADGVEIGKYFAENRSPVDSAAISPWVFKALISTEDKRFFEHSGIDLKRLASVAYGLATFQTDRGGGSTISQQLAKNLYNTRKKEMSGLLYKIPIIGTITFKIKEWITAIELEKRFTKGEIATLYLNTVDYGNNTFGIKTASKTYFNKSPDKLKPEEAAVLVGLQKATTFYNPIRNPKNAKKRRNTVLNRMVENGDISQKEVDKILEQDIKLNVNIENPYDGQGNYFKVALAKFIENWSKDNDLDIDLFRDGLKIYTTIDSRMQTYAEGAVEQHMRMLQKEFNAQWKDKNPWIFENGQEIPNYIENAAKKTDYYKVLSKKYENSEDSVWKYLNKPHKIKVFSWDGSKEIEMSTLDSIRYYKRFLQAGTMAFDPYSGFIKAWVGGINYDYFKYDHVKQGKRQPGSVFKPIVYTAAIDGILDLSPCDKRLDKKMEFKWKENGVEKLWEPKNANGTFSNSNLTLRSALSRSVNSVAVQLTQEIGSKNVVEYAKKMGIKSKMDPVVSIGLGTSDVSLYDMVAAYGIFLNEGTYREPIFVFKIEDKTGKILFEFESKTKPAIKPESAYLMQYMLRGNVEEAGGTGRRLYNYDQLFKNGGQVAGKTGTTSNYSDAWYVGFTKDLVCGVWVGGDERSIHFRGGLGEGSKSALPIFGIFMNNVYKDKSLNYAAGPFPKPNLKIEKDYLNCYSTDGFSEINSDSLADAHFLDSLQKYKNRMSLDSNINLNKIQPIRKTDSIANPIKKEIKID
jgi:penicillin-binding protein 1A